MTDFASKDFDLDVLARVSEGNRVVRYAPDLRLFATWHGPDVTLFHVHDQTGTEVDVFSTDADLVTDDDAGAAIVRYFNYVREQIAGEAIDLKPTVIYAVAGNTRMASFLTSCNSCGINKPAPGRDTCTECMEEPV